MTWLKIDDQFRRHEKYHLAGENGVALWFAAAIECAAADREGLIPGHMLTPWSPPGWAPAKLKAAVRALVKSGLWHDHDTLCERCTERHGPLEPGNYRFHDWSDWQLEKEGRTDALARMRELRRKRLHRDRGLKLAIRTRDRDLCRYCGKLCTFGADHKSDDAGQFDHLDPFDPENAIDKIVCACRRCNRVKGERTWDQAGMTLHAPGYQAQIQPESVPNPATDPSRSGVLPRVGTGRDPGLDIQPESSPYPATNGAHR